MNSENQALILDDEKLFTRWLGTVKSQADIALWEWNVHTGEVVVNSRWYTMLGYRPYEFIATYESFQTLLHPDDRQRVLSLLENHIIQRNGIIDVEYRILCKNKEYRWIRSRILAVESSLNREMSNVVGSNTDIQRSKLEEIRLREREKRFAQFLDEMPLGVAQIDNKGVLIYNNGSLERIFGLSRWNLEKRGLASFLLDIRQQRDSDHLLNKQTPLGRSSKKILGDGREMDVEIQWIYNDDEKGNPNYTFFITDVTEQKRREEELHYLCFHDNLTGLYNRAYFEQEMNRLNTFRQLPLSIVIGDVNGLKLVNDTFGHKEGDRLLVCIAQVLKSELRNEDIICRWGGDEFAVVLPKTDEATAEKICSRILRTCKEADEGPIPLNISLGVACKTNPEQKINEIFVQAEEKLYRRKFHASIEVRNTILKSLKDKLAEKYNETQAHIEHLRQLAIQLGKSLKLSDNELNELYLLASLHDIGKIAIPVHIASKEEKLRVEEWEIMKSHSEVGYRLVRTLPEYAHIADKILTHHEKWDGTGYPLGLKRNEIPVLARILAIADAFDVMVNGRPYKKPLSLEEALRELAKGAGSHFDPAMVEDFFKIIPRVQ
ncbi:diguanylate cyclase [Heliobacillus mobilis]|uniref:Diguanylate cyclase n=1 Tax=Heliobacterium mobile TaxID=28064 RepID=A0A6I3SMP6_HELMO|nr:HD domain-containing phosphohydrolase [Heliobacterium mobile]MTV50005.1 diguanylate cyclase [Heliobacterium mobile]